ncbi:MAG: hypothetical protein JW757_10490 [Anaerolineales bacterium]|nr:hypothetical protein [Anaerolineales bacterium]
MSDDIWVVEKDQVMVEGEALTFSVQFIGATTVASPDTKCYKNGTDYSSTALSGSSSASGDTVTCETVTAQANDAGTVYVMVVSATVDGNTEIRKFLIRIVGPEDE